MGQAALELGWDASGWDAKEWPLPTKASWEALPVRTRELLGLFGETPDSWIALCSTGSGSREFPSLIAASGDMRPWRYLSYEEKSAARGLGFTPGSWESTDMADLHEAIVGWGPTFEGCITQG